MKKKKEGLIGSIFVIVAGMLWGLTGVFVRFFTNLGLSSMQIVAFKITTAAILMFFYCLIFNREALKIKWKDIWVFICSGLISLDIFSVCYFSTIQKTSLSVAAVLLYLSPVFVMILSAIIFKEKMTFKKCVACALAFLGCLFVSGLVGSDVSIPMSALLTGLASALGYALFSIFGEIALRKGYSPITITTYSFLFSIIGIAFFVKPLEIAEAAAKVEVWKFILYAVMVSIVTALAPYVLYTTGLARVSPSKAAIMASIEPVMATIVGLILFSEVPNAYGVVGIILVILAIVLINSRNLKRLIKPKSKKKKRNKIEEEIEEKNSED